jgi:hypothetical protein
MKERSVGILMLINDPTDVRAAVVESREPEFALSAGADGPPPYAGGYIHAAAR